MTAAASFDRLAALDLLGLGPAAADVAPSGSAAPPPPSHPRAAAFLLRRALEQCLDAYLRSARPGLLNCRAETKVVWLAQQLGPALAGRYAAVWSNLSAACHYHQYALPPTLPELRAWRDEVTSVLRGFPR